MLTFDSKTPVIILKHPLQRLQLVISLICRLYLMGGKLQPLTAFDMFGFMTLFWITIIFLLCCLKVDNNKYSRLHAAVRTPMKTPPTHRHVLSLSKSPTNSSHITIWITDRQAVGWKGQLQYFTILLPPWSHNSRFKTIEFILECITILMKRLLQFVGCQHIFF